MFRMAIAWSWMSEETPAQMKFLNFELNSICRRAAQNQQIGSLFAKVAKLENLHFKRNLERDLTF